MSRERDDRDGRERMWFYLDQTGTEFGPFPASAMREWYDNNEFRTCSDRLPVRLPEWNYYRTLQDVYQCERPSYFVGALAIPPLRTSSPAPQEVEQTNASFLHFTQQALIDSPALMPRREQTIRRRLRDELSLPSRCCISILAGVSLLLSS
eukprot:TRINITY_DN23347_c0_g1_i1.p1 TRINITY_DN23347_c0_g1~~TRINITY_DN23347_c0_g1_i1.p1  ORF type:complete len:151 (+),score=8.79 TRINITY_DN23347_c0_g1_i1:119-571(+)